MSKAPEEGAFLFCDTHCHLDAPSLISNIDDVLDDAYQNGVREILVTAVADWNFDAVISLSKQNEFVYPALGLHPLYIQEHQECALIRLEAELNRNKCAAIGEIGLDFFMDQPQREKQEKFLIEQLQIANQHKLPVTLHSRKSHDVLSKILKTHVPIAGGAVHGFTGSFEQAKRFIDLGLHIGVGGAITYPRANKTRNTISRLPMDALVLETDAPDMPVCGYQGQPNTPSRIKIVYETLQYLKDENSIDMCNRLRKISQNLFFS